MSLLDRALDATIVLSFDRTGYERHARDFDPEALDHDLTGRRCLVTGANAGIGRATATALVERGASVHLLCRNRDRAEEAAATMRGRGGPVAITLVDLSDLSSVARAADELADVGPIDVLVHNAGVLPDDRHLTDDGLELTVATNLVGPHLLTHRLWPQLCASDDGRLIFVSSGGMYGARLDVDHLRSPPEPFSGVQTYAQTKRAQVIVAELLAAQAPPGLHVSSMHPGWAHTGSVESSLPTFFKLTKPILRSPEQGADTVVWLAAAPTPHEGFYFDRERRKTHLRSGTRETHVEREELWQWLDGQIGAPEHFGEPAEAPQRSSSTAAAKSMRS